MPETIHHNHGGSFQTAQNDKQKYKQLWDTNNLKKQTLTTNLYSEKDRQQKQELFWITNLHLTLPLSLGYIFIMNISTMLNQIIRSTKSHLPFPLAGGVWTVTLLFLQKYWNQICWLFHTLNAGRQIFDEWGRTIWSVNVAPVPLAIVFCWECPVTFRALKSWWKCTRNCYLTPISTMTAWIWTVKFIPVCSLC